MRQLVLLAALLALAACQNQGTPVAAGESGPYVAGGTGISTHIGGTGAAYWTHTR